jgi:putative ABC transport system permease protein
MIAIPTTLFGALGLVLSAVGLHGMVAYMVEQRTGEIMALGAHRGRVLRMVLRGAFSQVAIGIGIPAAIGAGKLMTQQLFSVRPWDPVMLASATSTLGPAALRASALPAWRAVGVEPWWRYVTNEGRVIYFGMNFHCGMYLRKVNPFRVIPPAGDIDTRSAER